MPPRRRRITNASWQPTFSAMYTDSQKDDSKLLQFTALAFHKRHILYRCGKNFNGLFVANFLPSLSVKKFRKSVNIWRRYGQELSDMFFDSRCKFYSKPPVASVSNSYHYQAIFWLRPSGIGIHCTILPLVTLVRSIWRSDCSLL